MSYHLNVDFHTVIICQHVAPIHIDSTTSVASLWQTCVACQHTIKLKILIFLSNKKGAKYFNINMGYLTEKSLSLSVSRSLFSA